MSLYLNYFWLEQFVVGDGCMISCSSLPVFPAQGWAWSFLLHFLPQVCRLSLLILGEVLADAVGLKLEETSLGRLDKVLFCSFPLLLLVPGFDSFWNYDVALWHWKKVPLVSLSPWSSYKISCSWGILKTVFLPALLPTEHSLPLSLSPCCCSYGAWDLLELYYSTCGNLSICQSLVKKQRWKPQLELKGSEEMYLRKTLLQSSWQVKWLFDHYDLREANIVTYRHYPALHHACIETLERKNRNVLYDAFCIFRPGAETYSWIFS